MTLSKTLDETPIADIIEAARKFPIGSELRRCQVNRGIAKIIAAKDGFKHLKGVMTPAEQNDFWTRLHSWSCQLNDLKGMECLRCGRIQEKTYCDDCANG